MALDQKVVPGVAHPANPRPGRNGPPRPKLDAHAVQHTWLREHRGQVVGVRLLDGKLLRGKLAAFDTFTIALESDGGVHLLFKQAIAYLVPTVPGEAARP